MTEQFTSNGATRAVLCLISDAYGGTGGIALYNRDVLKALSDDPSFRRIVCLPRTAPNPAEAVPEKVDNDTSGIGGMRAYIAALWRQLRSEKFDLIYCAHVNLIPLAWLAARVTGRPWVLCLYGFEAWEPFPRRMSRWMVRDAALILSISKVTLDRFRSWCPVPEDSCALVPNALHPEQFGIRARDPALMARYGLTGRQVMMTVGRLDPLEQAKGFDRLITLMPMLLAKAPDLAYVVVGKGGDQPRLEALARHHGVIDRVVFTGFVPEADKADHYNLADVFAMPSVFEGFGFVFLEALACGVPCVGSAIDGGRDALRDGALGTIVDPFDEAALAEAILNALKSSRHIPDGLAHFYFPAFAKRLLAALNPVLAPDSVRGL